MDGSEVRRVSHFQRRAGGGGRERGGGEGREGGGVEGDGDGGVGGEFFHLGGEEEGPEGAPALMRLEREESVQYLWMSPHPVLKLLWKTQSNVCVALTHCQRQKLPPCSNISIYEVHTIEFLVQSFNTSLHCIISSKGLSLLLCQVYISLNCMLDLH